MPNVDDTKPIDLDAIDTMLPDILRRCALVLADPRSEAGQTSTDLAHAVQAMAPLLTEVRRLTDANTRLTDLVRHQRGALHTEGLITDAEYADLAGLTGSPARLEGYDALRGELALQTRATNVAIGERDEARTALATARLDGARAMLREVEARAEGVAERHEGLAKAARAKDDRNRAAAKQAAAEAVFGAIREIRAIDPAAVAAEAEP